jgi:hypothetical protein
MSFAVLRIYENAPGIVDDFLAHLDEIRALLLDVKGFQQWGAARTESGAVTFTACETAEACTETVAIAANFMAQTLADKHYPSPTVISGELIYSVTAGKPDAQPAVALNIFSDPPPAQLKERATARRDTLLALPGFRSTFAIGPTNLGGGATLLVADDKTSLEAIRQSQREYIEKEYPEAMPTTPPRTIFGQAVARIVGEPVTA